jgi:hypothetical protein
MRAKRSELQCGARNNPSWWSRTSGLSSAKIRIVKRGSSGRGWLWIVLGSGAYLVRLLLGKNSVIVENFYSRGFFVGFRSLWDHTLGYSLVPLLYVLIAAVVARGIERFFRRVARKKVSGHRPTSLFEKIGRGALLVGSRLGILAFFFYVLWGFNYDRISVDKQLGLDVGPVDLATLRAEAERTERALADCRASIPLVTDAALSGEMLPPNLEADIRRALVKVLSDAGYPVTGRGRVRRLWPGGWLMRFSSTGFYFPYCGEGYIAANLTPAERPFVMAHELVHVYGITDEGAANFLGFLACEASDDHFVRYAGQLAYWEYVFPELVRASRDDAKELAARLPVGVRADLRAAFENWNRFRGRLQEAALAVYGQYLKSQGVKEGIKSYDRFVALVVASRKAATFGNTAVY